jgi:hypothetical protein
MAMFSEVFRCSGVDEGAQAMIVPLYGANVVALVDGDGLRRREPTHPSLDIQEIDSSTFFVQSRALINDALAQPGIDPQDRTALTPNVLMGRPRFFVIRGKGRIGPTGVPVEFIGHGSRVAASLEVVVFDRKTVKLSIWYLQVRDASKRIILHSKRPEDPKRECNSMNVCWVSQTNIAFNLISSNPVLIDDTDPSTKAELVRAWGLRDDTQSKLSPENAIDFSKLKGIFSKLKDNKADLTMFRVGKVLDGSAGEVNGVTSPEGYSVVGDSQYSTTMAHEAGHFLGRGIDPRDGILKGLDHQPDSRSSPPLMREGGAGWQIPFELAKVFRKFFDRH